ncbi:MAG TPA: type I pullulanase [Kiritimatiellia bacterium]|nr:type I pullulanase [Kiritimatiellia bacterium]
MSKPHPSFDSSDFVNQFHADCALGALWTGEATEFRAWAPTASEVELRLYRKGHGADRPRRVAMVRGAKGVWNTVVAGDLHGTYYTFGVKHRGKSVEAVDPYAKSTGANGQRGMVCDFGRTHPKGWEKDGRLPEMAPTDAIIYELHVRDLTIHESSGVKNKGKYLGLIETGTRGPGGVKTGLDHLKELGITHLHLLPLHDFMSIDETKPAKKQYNWGYDPQNYNVPEGWYATDATDGAVRIREMKEMVQGLHKAGIRVVMDVVYNHTYQAGDSCFNRMVPGYYYRMNKDGTFSNGSGCGNETASERSMFRKYMIDSLVHWATEYHIDGFRFDLMGLHDLDTMNEIRKALDKVDPGILLYGEGWTGGESPLPDDAKAIKRNAARLERIGVFSDDTRDGVKGPVWEASRPGFVNGYAGMEETIKFAVVAATRHSGVRYKKVNYSDRPWAREPHHCVNYVSAHDNHTLWDKLALAGPKESEADRIKMQKLSNAIVLTSQGISFLHAGVDMLRTKKGEENSYNKPDDINALDWGRKKTYKQVFDYYKGLIALRKGHPALRLPKAKQIRELLSFLPMPSAGMVGFVVDGRTVKDPGGKLVVIYNATRKEQVVDVPGPAWGVLADGRRAAAKPFRKVAGNQVKVGPLSVLVLASAK